MIKKIVKSIYLISKKSLEEINSLLNFEALTDMKLASFNAKEFEKLMVNNIEIREFGNSVLRKKLSQKVDKEIGLVSLAAKERLQKLREQFPMLENLVPHSVIASYLGITNVSLSRLRKKMPDESILSFVNGIKDKP